MMDFLDKYFKHDMEYPDDVTNDILPPGILYSYIATTFLNGFINYVDIKSAWLLDRYCGWEADDINCIQSVHIQDPPNSRKWKDTAEISKKERFKLLTEKGRGYHSSFNDFGDDVVILARDKNRKDLFYFFWFDMDCSDSCIGRFIEKDFSKVLADFKEWAESHDCGYLPKINNKQIPLSYFTGWISG